MNILACRRYKQSIPLSFSPLEVRELGTRGRRRKPNMFVPGTVLRMQCQHHDVRGRGNTRSTVDRVCCLSTSRHSTVFSRKGPLNRFATFPAGDLPLTTPDVGKRHKFTWSTSAETERRVTGKVAPCKKCLTWHFVIDMLALDIVGQRRLGVSDQCRHFPQSCW